MNALETWERLTSANKAYRLGDEIMADCEYDDLLDGYIVGSGKDEWDVRRLLMDIPGKVRHEHMMGSLKKVTAGKGDLLEWWNTTDSGSLFGSEKIDGMSLVANFEDGFFVKGITRGDGTFGENQTEKCRHIIPNLKCPFTGTIRGELTMTFGTFEELKKLDPSREHKNLRNSTVGIIGHNTCYPDLCVLVKFIAFEIVGSDDERIEQIASCKDMGLHVPKTFQIDLQDVSEDTLVNMYEKYLNSADYMVDGLVLHGDTWCGENDVYYPKHARAFKVNDTNETSEVTGIDWTLSKTGRLTPVVEIEPIHLNGTTVARASAYNASHIFSEGIVIGSRVTVQKSGDIIPCIIKVEGKGTHSVDEIFCPCCSSAVAWDENKTHLHCANQNCSGKQVKMIESFIVKLGIENISEKSLIAFEINTFDELMGFVPDQNYKKQFRLHIDILDRIYGAPKEKLYGCLTWPGAGRKTIQKIVDFMGLDKFEDLMFNGDEAEFKDLKLPEGIGVITLVNIQSVFLVNAEIVANIVDHKRYKPEAPKAIVEIKPTGDSLQGLSFCVTGKTERSRKELQDIIKANGGKIAGVSGKLNTLVIGANAGPSKLKKCETLGVKVVAEADFLKTLNII